jgi:hypothetical protein
MLMIFIMHTCVHAEDDLHLSGRGPFQIRNQFPISLQFLSFHADDAFTLTKNDFQVSINYSQSNTFAQSSGILKNLSDSNSRIDLTPDLTKQLEVTDGNANRFLIDSGIGRTTINFKYGLTDRFTLGFTKLPVSLTQVGQC